ncbi:MAG: hypothetical protein JW760_02560 [Spirochaetales bacterium]|nr:hypothetical protein [Spirochaetales bacterium]
MLGTGLSSVERLDKGLEFLKGFTVKDDLANITMPALAMVGEGDGDALIGQAREFINGISSKEKHMHLFSMAQDGSDDHCQLDNRSRGAQVMFDFFDDVFNTEHL